jgi:dihydroorotate dehydrogenase electron transfer subunit
MLAAVRRHALETGVEAYLALETTMACGFGACLGCAVPRAAASGSRRYLRLCVEGPVLECREVAP